MLILLFMAGNTSGNDKLKLYYCTSLWRKYKKAHFYCAALKRNVGNFQSARLRSNF